MGAFPSTILTQSMEPTFKPGDVVMVERSTPPSEVKIGDVVSIYEKSGEEDTFTHRVTGVTLSPNEPSGYSFTTQGDNNNTPDEPIRGERIKGKVITWPGTNILYMVPKVGLIRNYPMQTIAVFVLFFLFILISSIFSKGKEKRTEKDKTRQQEEELARLREEIMAMKTTDTSGSETNTSSTTEPTTVDQGNDSPDVQDKNTPEETDSKKN